MKSPNFDDRPFGAVVDTIVFHYTDMLSCEEAVSRLCNPDSKVSSHFVISEEGDIIQLVSCEKRAWHAGKSFWRGREGINSYSIGIELCNPGHFNGYVPFPEEQINSLVKLCKETISENQIDMRNIVGHSDIAPYRKMDPGELFPWKRLAAEGIGIWPDSCAFEEINKYDINQVVKLLGDVGYDVRNSDDEFICSVITAFQRRYNPEHLTGEWSEKDNKLLLGLFNGYNKQD